MTAKILVNLLRPQVVNLTGLCITDQITITDATGAVIFSTGFGSAPNPVSLSTTSSSITVTVTPNPTELAGTGIVAGDADNWDLSGTFSTPPVAATPAAPAPNFNSLKARITGNLNKFLPLKRVS